MSMYSSQPSAPGAAAPAGGPPTTTGTAPAEGPPPAAGPGGAGAFGGPLSLVIMVLPILLIFMTMRGQTKKQKQVGWSRLICAEYGNGLSPGSSYR